MSPLLFLGFQYSSDDFTSDINALNPWNFLSLPESLRKRVTVELMGWTRYSWSCLPVYSVSPMYRSSPRVGTDSPHPPEGLLTTKAVQNGPLLRRCTFSTLSVGFFSLVLSACTSALGRTVKIPSRFTVFYSTLSSVWEVVLREGLLTSSGTDRCLGKKYSC